MMNLIVSLLALTAVVWVMIPGGEGMQGRDSEIQPIPPSPKATSSRSPVMASSPPSSVTSEKKLNWFAQYRQNKKQKEEEKEKAAAAKRKPASGPPVPYYKDVTNIEASSWSQMIKSILSNDCCTRGMQDASGYCKRVTGYLDRLKPENRSDACPRVMNGRCAEIGGQKVCAVDVYTKTKSERPVCGTGAPFCGCANIKIEKQLVPFRECVGTLEF
nr:PREDICTED: uncharacterized protein LOC109042002 [Bemisia tabaci]